MIWNKYSIKTTEEDAELVCAALLDFDIADVQLESDMEFTEEEMNQMYADFIKEPPKGETCRVSFFLEQSESPEGAAEQAAFIEKIKNGLKEAEEIYGIAPVELEGETLDSTDWENKWKEFFKPFLIGDIAIKPTWETLPDDIKENANIVIEIDPGMAFGSGLHETTRLCMLGLKKYMKPGDLVFDVGCGSGILGIAARKLGAGKIMAVDIDENSVEIAHENYEANHIFQNFELVSGNILTVDSAKSTDNSAFSEFMKEISDSPADIVLANILADVIEPLTAIVHKYLKKGGIYVTSGIIDTKEQLIIDAVNNNSELEFIEVVNDGDWRSIVARRK